MLAMMSGRVSQYQLSFTLKDGARYSYLPCVKVHEQVDSTIIASCLLRILG